MFLPFYKSSQNSNLKYYGEVDSLKPSYSESPLKKGSKYSENVTLCINLPAFFSVGVPSKA